MALDTYANLQASIASWMHRSDLAGSIPDFITLAEARIAALLMSNQQDIAGTITTTPGIQFATLPSDLSTAHSLSIQNVSPALDFLTPEQLEQRYSPTQVGAPKAYTLIGQSIYFGPTPDAAYTIRCFYQSFVPSLSATAPTNSLLTKWPNIYLWGALVEAAKFARDEPKRQAFEQDFLAAIEGVNIVDWCSGGPMRIRTDTNTP